MLFTLLLLRLRFVPLKFQALLTLYLSANHRFEYPSNIVKMV